VLDYVPVHGTCCSPAHSVGLHKQPWNRPMGEKWYATFLSTVGWGSFPWVRGSGCCRVWFWLMVCLLFVKRKRERKREKQSGSFFPEQKCLAACTMPGFSWLLGAIKSYFKGQSLNSMCTWFDGGYYFS
jgi:hypothetical protein